MNEAEAVTLTPQDLALAIYIKKVKGTWSWVVAVRPSPQGELSVVVAHGEKASYDAALMSATSHIMDSWKSAAEAAVYGEGASHQHVQA